MIEAKRLKCQQAAFIVQAFKTQEETFQDYAVFCDALQIAAVRGGMATTTVEGIRVSIGWADCPIATDADLATTAG